MRIIHQNTFERWDIPDKSVQAIITSPPYWSLRHYQIQDIVIGGRKDCEHKFEIKDMALGHENRQGKGGTLNGGIGSLAEIHGKKVGEQGFCSCGAWKGQYGLEPDFRLFIEHTRLWAKEAWRCCIGSVLRDGNDNQSG